jgi:Activator of Hsp90 ATPase homolog 1-like protein
MNTSKPAAGPIVLKSVIVAAPLAVAFEVFTAQIEAWWPMASHHIGEATCAAVVIEPRAGGRWYERGVDGVECTWGQVLVWEAPRRVVLVWQLSAQFRYDPSIHTEVDVRFLAIDERTTRVELEHRGLEAYGADAVGMHDAFNSPNGWNGMLEHYAEVASRPVAAVRA